MFAFIDESGHTGKKISDISQPNFYTLGIISKLNPDVLLRNDVNFICQQYGIKELHGAELGHSIEVVAPAIYKVLQKLSPKFFLAEVDKKYLAYAKLYDTLFDNVENPGARWQTYQARPFRIMLLHNFIALVPLEIAYNFYENCLFASSEESAITVLKETCKKILYLLKISTLDSRSKQLIEDPLKWALENPKDITTYNTRKIDRWRHLPNVVTFMPILDMLSRYARKMNSKVNKIIHDEQNQMKQIFIEIHKVSSRKTAPDKGDLRENGYFHLRSIKESFFEMKESINSPGLQLVDICLSLLSHKEHILREYENNPESANFLLYIINHGSVFDFTFDGFIKQSNEFIQKIMTMPFTDDQLKKGTDIINKMEKKWQKDYIEASKRKT
jgi:hypothetical protein